MGCKAHSDLAAEKLLCFPTWTWTQQVRLSPSQRGNSALSCPWKLSSVLSGVLNHLGLPTTQSFLLCLDSTPGFPLSYGPLMQAR